MIKGVWTALPNLDYFHQNEHIVTSILSNLFTEGIEGILALGTTGQGPDKSLNQRMSEVELLTRCCEPKEMIVGVTANAVDDVRALIEHASVSGVRGVAITAPYYGTYAEQELHVWLDRTLDRAPKNLEYYIYNIPGAMHHRWTVASLQVASNHVKIAGIKDSSGDLSQLLTYLEYARGQECSVMVGDERFGLYSLLMGGAGFVSGFSSAYPRLMCDLYDACTSANITEATRLQRDVNEHVNQLLRHPGRKMVGVLVDWMRASGIAPPVA